MKKEKKTIKAYDRTLRTAHTPEQIADAEEQIKKITTAQELLKATNGPDRFLQTRDPTPNQLLYAQYAEEDDFLSLQIVTAQANVKHLQDSLRFAQRLDAALGARQSGLRYHIQKDLEAAKDVVRQADLTAKAEDGFPTPVTIALDPEALFSEPPTKSADSGSKLPFRCRDLVRPLTIREKEVRQGHKCHRCHKSGHWSTDHCSYTCQTCKTIAPGHSSGSKWCPAVTKQEEDDSSPFEDGYYDDWFGDDGEHNLAT